MIRRFTATFIAGLFALLPLLITVGLIGFVMGKLNAWLGPQSPFGMWLTTLSSSLALSYILSIAIVVLFIWCIGWLARRVTGQRLTRLMDQIIARIPFINKVYKSVEQVVALLNRKDGDAASALSNVVLARIGNVRVLGMLASPHPVVIHGVPHFIVYLPSTPIPASGQNLVVPCADVEDVDISVEELTKILLSLGSLGAGILNSKSPLILPGPIMSPAPAS
jgi:uncharacterized membrane protein